MSDSVRVIGERIGAAIDTIVFGQRSVRDGVLVALLARGHVLLEGVPGTAKTLLAEAVARTIDAKFARVQFTPDLMPSDVTGSMMLTGDKFAFRAGPIFTDLLLCDEINRAPAKTQSALLEAMQERAVTTDGARRSLSPLFTVLATQNPIEQDGTYPLPEAELDRFMLRLVVDYPDEADEQAILRTHHGAQRAAMLDGIAPVVSRDALDELRNEVDAVKVSDEVIGYVAALTRASRVHLSLEVGASPRAGLDLLRAAKAQAALQGRDFVTPDDVKRWVAAAFAHRLVLLPGPEINGETTGGVVDALLGSVTVPA